MRYTITARRRPEPNSHRRTLCPGCAPQPRRFDPMKMVYDQPESRVLWDIPANDLYTIPVPPLFEAVRRTQQTIPCPKALSKTKA